MSAIKIIFLLGFLIFIHEGGHFTVAKLCKVKVNQFAIGFGPKIVEFKGKETLYALRLIPLGGFVSLEGENGDSTEERAFNNASIPKRVAIVAAGAMVNIIFGLAIYFVLASIIYGNAGLALKALGNYSYALIESIKMLFTGNVGINDLTGPVGISGMVSKTTSIKEYVYLMSIISTSLGITNLLPFPALDGGKIVLLILEAIRKKPLKQETEIQIQLLGFSILIVLALIVTYNDVLRIIK
ncbi:MAG: site-2 protease family protein [Clostridia bacterium]|nr:site-2 protease family protein [Clostridia bacterium]